LFLSVPLLAASLFMGTPAANAASPPPVNLGTAGPFAILAGQAITDVPSSVITGNVGLSPGTAAAIGVTCPEVTGTIFGVDAAFAGGGTCFAGNPPLSNKTLVDNAKLDLTAAYTDALTRAPTGPDVPTELGGTTKTPGVYKSADTTFQITAGAGPLILDAQGDPNGVFIFKMNAEGTGLIVNPGSQVQLTGGAQACNVFWQVDTATINTTAVFKGNILALNQITVAGGVGTGANVEGRLLARNANVTLDHTTVTRSVCATTSAPPAPPAVPAVPKFTG
jgi:hypothetical protein